MNARERFRRALSYKPYDRIPVLAFEPYEQSALERWVAEGMSPRHAVEDCLGMDRFVSLPIDFSAFPRFENTVLREDSEETLEIDPRWGATVRRKKRAPTMYYGYTRHPVQDIHDWLAYEERFRASAAWATPPDMNCYAEQLAGSPNPVRLVIFPYFFRFGFYAMGMEAFLLAFYEQPELVRRMFAFWNDFVLSRIRPYLGTGQIDCVAVNEDVAYKNGPHVSPVMYREFWLPCQDRLIDECRAAGIDFVSFWSAGDFDVLIPTLLEHGYNCLIPIERCSPAMDPFVLRARHGRRLLLCGGIPKAALIAGKDAVDAEIERLLPLVREGGFIPALDDMVPPEVPYDVYRHYVGRLCSVRPG
jgi:hypothetical protein